jgi:CRP-like cAMP-binding protein
MSKNWHLLKNLAKFTVNVHRGVAIGHNGGNTPTFLSADPEQTGNTSTEKNRLGAIRVAKDTNDTLTRCCACNILPLISPYNTNLLLWQCALLVLIFFNMLLVPYELAFEQIESLQPASLISDAAFLIDVVVSFHTMLILEEPHNDRIIIIDDRSTIARQYFWGYFVVDVASIGPPFYDSGAGFMGSLKVLKMVRVFRAMRIFKSIVHVSPDAIAYFRVVKMTFLVMYASHVVACLFYGMAHINNDLNWVSANFESKDTELEVIYVTSLYWAVMTLTSVGYGDVSAANEYEKLFSIVVMVIGAIFYAVVLGSVTAAIQSISSSSEPFLEHMRCIEKFIKRHNLCDELADRLRETTAFQWQQLESANIEQVMGHFHPELTSEILLTIHRPMLIKSSFFQKVEEGFVKVVIRELKMHVCLAGDYIFRGGDDGHCMFLLNQGSVGVYEDETFLHSLEPGDTFGEGAVLSPDLSVRTESIITEVRSVIYSLSRGALLRTMESFPKVRQVLDQEVAAILQRRVHAAKTAKRRSASEGVSGTRCTVTVDVLQGAEMVRKDVSGFSDPYCVVTFVMPCQDCMTRERMSLSADENSGPNSDRVVEPVNWLHQMDASSLKRQKCVSNRFSGDVLGNSHAVLTHSPPLVPTTPSVAQSDPNRATGTIGRCDANDGRNPHKDSSVGSAWPYVRVRQPSGGKAVLEKQPEHELQSQQDSGCGRTTEMVKSCDTAVDGGYSDGNEGPTNEYDRRRRSMVDARQQGSARARRSSLSLSFRPNTHNNSVHPFTHIQGLTTQVSHSSHRKESVPVEPSTSSATNQTEAAVTGNGRGDISTATEGKARVVKTSGGGSDSKSDRIRPATKATHRRRSLDSNALKPVHRRRSFTSAFASVGGRSARPVECYCEQCEVQMEHTQCKRHTLDPVWNQTYHFMMTAESFSQGKTDSEETRS